MSLRDYIFFDVIRNQDRPENGRRYFAETLEWAWAIQQQSRTAWKLVRKSLHRPCESLLDAHFAHVDGVLSQALLDLDRVGELISLWDRSSHRTATDRRVILSVHAVSFRPRAAIVDDLSVEGLDDINELENREVFEQFLFHPKEFTAFLKNHWNHAYSALFAFQIQPILPGLPCCIIHT